jgi:hypothetical protein
VCYEYRDGSVMRRAWQPSKGRCRGSRHVVKELSIETRPSYTYEGPDSRIDER